MEQALVVQGLVTVGVGAISGGITNAVAIWMLFHPYEPRGVGPFRIQGAIPKNKARLARSIGRTVGERLLTPEDLTRRLGAPVVREAFDRAVGDALGAALERERGPLREQLPGEVAATLDRAVAGIAPRAADRVATYAGSPEFERLVTGWIARIREEVGDRPLSSALTEERRAALAGQVERWVSRLAEDPEVEGTLRGFVDRQLERLSRDDTPLLDRLPPGIVGALEHAITDYLPIALERL
ncbi:MAG TPA: DUF445 family protein, partial [Gemmatimonadales bacterium]